jgi:chromosomal replication initiation ATPase DnaA
VLFLCKDVPEYFNKLHNISGKVANKFYNDMKTPVQIILGPIGSGKTFALQITFNYISISTKHFS